MDEPICGVENVALKMSKQNSPKVEMQAAQYNAVTNRQCQNITSNQKRRMRRDRQGTVSKVGSGLARNTVLEQSPLRRA